ncbi:MAG: response regulator transcription factor [Deltaproteobacteria bacterium]|nr:MAG: response regulator transcription factor [Deltaproteobacteria bacterium]
MEGSTLPEVILTTDIDLPFLKEFLVDKFLVKESQSKVFSYTLIDSETPSLVILVFPFKNDKDGIEWIREMREYTLCPIVLVGQDIPFSFFLEGLDAGADDFLCQDLAECFQDEELQQSWLTELYTRMIALVRRAGRVGGVIEPGQEIVCGPLVLHLNEMNVSFAGSPVALTPTEFRLLQRLARNPNTTLPHEDLLTDLWGKQFANERQYLRVYISRLREKLSLEEDGDLTIETVPKEGYMLRIVQPEELKKANECQL